MQSRHEKIISESESIKGDTEQFSVFYDKYAPALYGQILRVVHKKDLAEKIMEKVFRNAFIQQNLKESNDLPFFISLLNHSRKKTYGVVKAIKVLKACSCS